MINKVADSSMDLQGHWNKVYAEKGSDVSWYQLSPEPSLGLILKNVGKGREDCRVETVVDVGGGDSSLILNLLEHGFKGENLTCIDISRNALERNKEKVGRDVGVNWLEKDVRQLNVEDFKVKVNVWHDRAAFHFLTEKEDVDRYLEIVSKVLAKDGTMILATFAPDGPEKCSGLPVKRYGFVEMDALLDKIGLKRVEGLNHLHETPWKSKQSFTFGVYKR